ncbi:MAG: hydrogenase maturation nickel metallochaperone HypA [Bacteroidota bacterium]
MHEISLVRNIFNTLESEFSTEELQRLTAIDLKVGLLSNVEPTLMQSAFDAVTSAEEKHQEVKLKVEVVPIKIHCLSCGSHSMIKNYKFVCANCGAPSNNVVQGTELLIHRVHFSEPEQSLTS